MREALNQNPDAAPEQILKQVRAAIDAFVQEAEQFDDLTMLRMEYRGGARADCPRDRSAALPGITVDADGLSGEQETLCRKRHNEKQGAGFQPSPCFLIRVLFSEVLRIAKSTQHECRSIDRVRKKHVQASPRCKPQQRPG